MKLENDALKKVIGRAGGHILKAVLQSVLKGTIAFSGPFNFSVE